MTAEEAIVAGVSDPFRIVLLLGLFYTMLRTRAVSGIWVPLAAGCVFVAVIIATVMQGQSPLPLTERILWGLVSNLLILAVILGLWQIWQRLRG